MRRIKRFFTSLLALTMCLSFATITHAAKTTDVQTKDDSEFGILSGYQKGSGESANKKEIIYQVRISKIPNAERPTVLSAEIHIYDHQTGQLIDTARGVSGENQTTSSFVWQASISNKRQIRSFGSHQAKSSRAVAVYTEIYGF